MTTPSQRLAVGDPAPAFTLTAADGSEVSLSDYAGRKVVVYFYPAAMTPGCTKQACDFRDSLSSLAAAGYQVLGVSPDSPTKLAKFTEKETLTFPVLSDEDHSVAAAFGAWGEKKNYGRVYEGLIRSTIVVAKDGTVAEAMYNVKATGHVERLKKRLNVA